MGKYQTTTQQAPSQLNKTAQAHASGHQPPHVQITHHVINTCTLVSTRKLSCEKTQQESYPQTSTRQHRKPPPNREGKGRAL
jgi:hypothetical protein